MYIIPATNIASFLSGIGKKYRGYMSTFPHRSIRNKDDIKFAAVNLYAYGTPFANLGNDRQLHYLKADIQHLEEILDPFVDKVWQYFNREPNTANNQANFDAFQEKLCDLFLEIFDADGKYSHTYGNAQKMVNMLFKYLTCFEDYLDFADLFSYCHMPIDRQILDKFAIIYHVPNTKAGEYRGVCWTRMSKEDYKLLLADYRATFMPIKGYDSWLGIEYYLWATAVIHTTGVHHATPIDAFYM